MENTTNSTEHDLFNQKLNNASINLASLNTENELDTSARLLDKLSDFFSNRLSNLENSNDLDRSNISIISKRSHNSSKVSTRDFNKTQAKEKFGFFSQKAAINMTDNTLFGN